METIDLTQLACVTGGAEKNWTGTDVGSNGYSGGSRNLGESYADQIQQPVSILDQNNGRYTGKKSPGLGG